MDGNKVVHSHNCYCCIGDILITYIVGVDGMMDIDEKIELVDDD